MYQEFTPSNVDEVSDTIFNKIELVAKNHGLEYLPKKISGNPNRIEIKFSALINPKKASKEPWKCFDKNRCKQFRESIEYWLRKLEKEEGLKVEVGNIRFDDNSINSKLIATISEEADNLEAAIIEEVGGKRNWLGKSFKYRNKNYTVVKANNRARKFKIIVEDRLGNEYGFPVSVVARYI